MRIIAGQYRSTALASVGKGDAGAHLRPTTDRVRESLFNVLTHQVDFSGARVLDLFAGTGALGLEALSRGAAHVTFVDDGRVAHKLIAQNIAKLKVRDQTRIITRDATRLGTCDVAAFDLIFLDPPYGKALGEKALSAVQGGGWLAPEALIVWEENAPMLPPHGFVATDRRKYGDSHVTFLSADDA